MRPLKVLATALALSLLAAPAFAEARPAKPPAAAKAGRGQKAPAKAKDDKREARILEALKNQGIDEARARKVIAVMKKYRTERMPVHQEMRKHREALRTLLENKSTDETAYTTALDGLEAQKKKLVDIQQRQVTEIRSLLKPSEQAKVLRLLIKAKKRDGGPAAHAGKGKQKNAKRGSQGVSNDVS